jgi:hypothetical protein
MKARAVDAAHKNNRQQDPKIMKRHVTTHIGLITTAAILCQVLFGAVAMSQEQSQPETNEDPAATQPSINDRPSESASDDPGENDAQPYDLGSAGRGYGRGSMDYGRTFGGGGGGPLGGGMMSRWDGGGEYPSDELDAAVEFMREHSPKRWEMLERRQGPIFPQTMRFIMSRYRNLKNLEREDSKLYKLRLQQLTIEDSIFAMNREMRQPISDERRQEILKEMRARVEESVDVWIEEREHRLARLEATVNRERERLESDRGRRQLMIDNRLERELDRVSEFIAVPPPPVLPPR